MGRIYELRCEFYSYKRTLLESVGYTLVQDFKETLTRIHGGVRLSVFDESVFAVERLEDGNFKLESTIFYNGDDNGLSNANAFCDWAVSVFQWLYSPDEESVSFFKLVEIDNGEQVQEHRFHTVCVSEDDDSNDTAPWTQPTGSHNAYSTDDKVMFRGKLYRSVINGNVWPPNKTGWSQVVDEGEHADWQQPAGAHDAYPLDDIVRHNGSLWISVAENNVWEPGVFGWEPYEP
jgi:hypothetical protein